MTIKLIASSGSGTISPKLILSTDDINLITIENLNSASITINQSGMAR